MLGTSGSHGVKHPRVRRPDLAFAPCGDLYPPTTSTHYAGKGTTPATRCRAGGGAVMDARGADRGTPNELDRVLRITPPTNRRRLPLTPLFIFLCFCLITSFLSASRSCQ